MTLKQVPPMNQHGAPLGITETPALDRSDPVDAKSVASLSVLFSLCESYVFTGF